MQQKKLNLALQGGGSHGAYTWGVLDRLLEEEDILINSVSGTSAGAMNAVVMADGYRRGGRPAAKEKLREFWKNVSQYSAFSNPIHEKDGKFVAEGLDAYQSWGYQWFEMLTRMFSPTQLNPYNFNPVRDILTKSIDWENINKGGDIHLFVTATSVRTGQPRVFRCHEISEDVLMASACLPFLFAPVVIEGEPFWDGGYMGNPSIWPLIYHTEIMDVLLVQINPIIRETVPTTAQDIANRLNEITFNSSLIAEMRAINFVGKLVDSNHLDPNKYRKILMHMISHPDEVLGLNAASKVNADWGFLTFLHQEGRKKADAWIKANKEKIGVEASIDIEEVFLSHASSSGPTGKKKSCAA